MAVRLRWRGWLILAAALLLFSACATASASNTIPGSAATTGPILVTTNLASYTTGDAIGATVTNGSKSDYFTQDGKSGCTVVQLEKYDQAKRAWTHVDACNASQATQTLLVAETSSIPYSLAPNSPADMNAWQAGTYRVSVTYTVQADGITNLQEAHSAAFVIHG